jgi:RNA polymerase sigma-70 factor, ECF subfamily
VALNRAVAACMRDGPEKGLAALAALEAPLASYHLFYAMRADFRRRLGQDARDDYLRALERAVNESERSFLQRRNRRSQLRFIEPLRRRNRRGQVRAM